MEVSQKNNLNANNSGDKILALTDAAVAKIKMMMEKEGKAGYYLRIGVLTGGCAGLSYDMSFQKNAYDNDLASEQGGIKIILNEDCVPFLKGILIDYVDTLKESGFKYKNPNAKSSCGCGTSFS